jgi:hypothetical protein
MEDYLGMIMLPFRTTNRALSLKFETCSPPPTSGTAIVAAGKIGGSRPVVQFVFVKGSILHPSYLLLGIRIACQPQLLLTNIT